MMKNEQPASEIKSNLLFSYRLFLAFFLLIGLANQYSLRAGISICIISMVNHTALDTMLNVENAIGNLSIKEIKLREDDQILHQEKIQKIDGPYVWNKEIQGHILGAFFYGYLISQVPAGWLADQFGCKLVILVFFGISAIATILTPIAVKLGGYVFLIIMRIITGIGSGAAFPCIINFLSKWAPIDERSKLFNIIFSGVFIGIIVTFPISGIVCRTIGWESIFYITGSSTCVWLILWCVLVSDYPSQARFISMSEKNYLILHAPEGTIIAQQKTPWVSLVTSPQVWGLMIACFCSDWGLFTYLTNIPTYFFEVLELDMTSNGFFSALPYLGAILTIYSVPHIADHIISKSIMSIRSTRILMTAFAFIVSSLFMILMTFINSSQHALAIFCLTAIVSFSSISGCGHLVNALDFAPAFAGIISGICNGFGALTGFLAPYVVSIITKDRTIGEWRIVFFLTAAIHTFGFIIFAITCRGVVLPWARIATNQKTFSDCELAPLNHDEGELIHRPSK